MRRRSQRGAAHEVAVTPHDAHVSGEAESVLDLERRIAHVAAVIRAAAEVPFTRRASDSAADGFVVSGIGGSEGPARLLVSCLLAEGKKARFLPLSAFVAGEPIGTKDEALCLFSQGLSPNAKAALSRAHELREATLFTSARADCPSLASFVEGGGHVITLPPENESPTLLRILGPAAAMLGAIRFVKEPEGLASLGDTLEARMREGSALVAKLSGNELATRLSWVTCGEGRALADGLAIKWLEGLGRVTPVWDVVGFAHGPFHAFYMEPMVLVALGGRSALFDALASMLVPERHTLVRLEPRLPFPLARLELEVLANALFFAAFQAAPRDMFSFPSKGRDGALYGLLVPVAGPSRSE